VTKAKLKEVDTADWDRSYQKSHETGLFYCCFQASIGPDGGQGAGLFGFVACNREWLESMSDENSYISKFVVVKEISFKAVERAAELVCAAVPHGDWDEVSQKLAELVDWEFEGYVP